MSEKLLPCPFCGGEAELITGAHRDGGYIENCACVRCKKCGARSYEFHECVTPDEVQGYASETWNRRAERTCRMEQDPDYDFVRCSACGYEEESNVLVAVGEGGLVVYGGNYCPNCGARVEVE